MAKSIAALFHFDRRDDVTASTTAVAVVVAAASTQHRHLLHVSPENL